jgi:4-amino-4-deoxy-L-arabinose transferase-like glycosyltransferase
MTDPRLRQVAALLSGVGVAVATLVVLVWTEPSLSIVWDEGYTLAREEHVRAWLRGMGDPAEFARTWRPPMPDFVQQGGPPPRPDEIDTRAKLLNRRALRWFWPFSREEPNGHPPFYAIVGLIGDLVVPTWDELPRARFGTMLAFSLAAGAIFAFFASRWDYWSASLAAGAWLLQPNLFAHAHYAGYDALLSSLWVGAILCFTQAVEPRAPDESPAPWGGRWGWAIGFGILAGCAAATKFTGWLLPLPFMIWTLASRNRRGFRTLLIGCATAALVVYACNPPWWSAPIDGMTRFLRSNLSRAQSQPINVQFLGHIIETPTSSLPWYNTIVWTAFVTPLGFLALAIIGAARAAIPRRGAKRRNEQTPDAIGQTQDTPPVTKGGPEGVKHPSAEIPPSAASEPDTPPVTKGGPGGVNRSMPAPSRTQPSLTPFATTALTNWFFLLILRALPHTPGHDGVRQFLPAFGCLALVAGLGAVCLIHRNGRWGRAIVAAGLAEGIISVALFMPVPLSYFSPAVGGLPGAVALGMEPTYYWDALTDDAITWLNRHTVSGRSVLFADAPVSWFYLRKNGRLRAPICPYEPGEMQWYVVQNRPGAFNEVTRALIASPGPKRILSEKWGVPLIWAFPRDLVDEVERQVRSRTSR